MEVTKISFQYGWFWPIWQKWSVLFRMIPYIKAQDKAYIKPI